MLTFADFLSKHYAKPDPFPLDQAEAFFHDLDLPVLSEMVHDSMNASITEAEVLQAINSLRPSSAPGPDGFSGLYYKKFAGPLVPQLPSSDALMAHITMLPKLSEDTPEPQAFQFIALLNEDMKILGEIVSHLIHRDQVCFVPGP